MTKRISAFLLLCAMLTSLAACGQAPDETETSAELNADTTAAEETEEVIADNLPERDFEGKTFTSLIPAWTAGLMAAEELAAGIESVSFKVPVCPVYQNVTALPSVDPEEIKKNLLSQLTSPVKWTQSVLNMVQDGAGEFIETGPGKVLQGLLSKIIKFVEI